MSPEERTIASIECELHKLQTNNEKLRAELQLMENRYCVARDASHVDYSISKRGCDFHMSSEEGTIASMECELYKLKTNNKKLRAELELMENRYCVAREAAHVDYSISKRADRAPQLNIVMSNRTKDTAKRPAK